MSQYYSYDPLTNAIDSNNNELYYDSQLKETNEIYNNGNFNDTINNNININNILNQYENTNENNLYIPSNDYQNKTISYDNNELNKLLNNNGFSSDSNNNYFMDSPNYVINNDYSSNNYNNMNSYLTAPNESDKIYYQTKNEEITIPQNFSYNNNYDINNIGIINNNSIHTQHKKARPIFKVVSRPQLDYSHTNSFHGSKIIESNSSNTLNYNTNKAIQLPNNTITQNDFNYNNEYIDNYNNYENDFNSLDGYIRSINNIDNYGKDEIILNYGNNSVENNYLNPTQNYFNDINYNTNTYPNFINQNNFSINDISDLKYNIPETKVIERRELEEKDFKNIIYTDIGMINLGNTCYINSCLQVLIHCPNFIYKFFEKFKTIKKEEAPISKNFYDICYAIVNTLNTQEKYIDISNFKNEFGRKHPIYGDYNPNDSQEFCRFFLEDLSSELNEVKTKAIYREYTENDQKSKKEQDKDFDNKFKEREKSIITDIFYSQIVTSFTCECKSKSYSFQKILDFPLLLPENEQSVDIIDLFKTYFQPETIDYEKKCEKCQKVIKRKKEMKISRPPEILILSLQRIDQKTQNKNECVVTFPQNLDMKDFIDSECGFDKECGYILFYARNQSTKK